MAVEELVELGGVADVVDVELLEALGDARGAAEPEDLARLDVGDPEDEAVRGELVGDGAVGEVGAAQVVEAIRGVSRLEVRKVWWGGGLYYRRCLKAGPMSESSYSRLGSPGRKMRPSLTLSSAATLRA